MASSSSSARRQKGKDTSEYKVVRGHFVSLVKLSQHVLTHFANELFTKMLISQLELLDAINKSQPMYDKATAMMHSVLDKIDNDSSCFYKLVACLRETGQDGIANDLEEALREDKQHCTSMPGASRLPQNIVAASSTRRTDTPSEAADNSIATTNESLEDHVDPGGLKFLPPVRESGSKLLPRGSVFVHSNSEDSEPQEDDSIAEQDHYNISQPREDQNVLQPTLEESTTKPSAAPIASVGSDSLATVKSTEKFRFPSRTLPHCMSVDKQLATRSLRQLTSGYGKAYRSSRIGGDTMDFCIKPVHPLAGKSPTKMPFWLDYRILIALAVIAAGIAVYYGYNLSGPHDTSNKAEMQTSYTISNKAEIASSSEVKSLDSMPTIADMHLISKGNDKVRVIEDVTEDCKTLGHMLGLRGNAVGNIWSNRELSTSSRCEQTIEQWLKGKGYIPVTWKTFIKGLEAIDHNELVRELRQILS